MYQRARILVLAVAGLLCACGGGGNGGGGGSGADTTPPTARVTPRGASLGIREALVITFSEAMNPDTLVLDGSLLAFAAKPTWSNGNTVLTIKPKPEDGAWESGLRTLTLSARDKAGHLLAELSIEKEVRLLFDNFQSAEIVIGQADYEGQEENRGGLPAGETLRFPYGDAATGSGLLFIPDTYNNRVLAFDGIPASDGASADFVLGQPDFTSNGAGTSRDGMLPVYDVDVANDTLYVADADNRRVLGFRPVPQGGPVSASFALGQPDLDSNEAGCSSTRFGGPFALSAGGGKLLVADSFNHRVLVWNTLPVASETPAEIVLGQRDAEHCTDNDDDQDGAPDAQPTSRTLRYPDGLWSDGERLAVKDKGNARILIWNSFPDTGFAPADLVLGQRDFASGAPNDGDQDGAPDAQPSAAVMDFDLNGLASNGLQLFVSDCNNNRILIWNRFPLENFAAADRVIGHRSFADHVHNDDNGDGLADTTPSARTFRCPMGVTLHRDRIIVGDSENHRYLVFRSR